MTEWFEDEEFWTAYAPLMFDEAHWAEVPEAVDAVLKFSGLSPGGRVLDVCCGVGRHSIELARRGFAVTGVDLTSAYLEAARETAEAAGLSPEWIKADARSFSREGCFDLCINLFTSFGYFATRDEDLLMLKNCARNLSPGGCFILETVGKEIAARDFIRSEEFLRAGWNVRTEYEIIGDWEAEKNRWILRDGETCVDRSFVLRLYSGYEMRKCLEQAGFRSIEIFGGLDGRPYDEKALSLVAVART
jgi:SAM-dependent methyltransferase